MKSKKTASESLSIQTKMVLPHDTNPLNTLFGDTAVIGSQLRTTLTFIGLDSGARLTIPLTITKTA